MTGAFRRAAGWIDDGGPMRVAARAGQSYVMTTIAHATVPAPVSNVLTSAVRPKAARAGAALATAARVAGHLVVAAATVAVLGTDTDL